MNSEMFNMNSGQRLWYLVIVVALNLLVSTASAQLSIDGGGLLLVQEGPAVNMGGDPVPENLSLGGTAFATSELGPELGIDYHYIENLNDGFYGNEYSWIGGDDDPFFETFAGIDLGATSHANVQSIAFGRSNVLSLSLIHISEPTRPY